MADKQPRWDATRITIVVLVVVFFVSSFSLSALVVWEQFFKGDDTSDITTTEDITNEGENTLEGTQLADLEPIETVSELQTIDQSEGSGAEVKPGDSVTVHYTGAVAATGTIFQSSLDGGQPVTFSLDGVIAGWTEGIPGMKEGGKRRLIIPAEKAYGANPPSGSGIPANAALVFDVELISIGE